MEPVKTCINSYPHPYIQWADGSLISLNKSYDFNNVQLTGGGIVITRTLTLSALFTFIQEYQQYHSCEERPMLLLWGSNDAQAWQYLGKTNRDHANFATARQFRFFRLGIYFANMKATEKYYSIVLDIQEKLRNI